MGDEWLGIGLMILGVALLFGAASPFVYQRYRRMHRQRPQQWWGKR